MTDNLNVIIKAQLDVNQTSKEINVQLGQLENKIKSLGIDIDMDGVFKSFNDSFKKVKESVNEINKSFGNIDVGNKFTEGFDKLKTRVKDVRDNVDSLAKVKIGLDSNGNIQNALLTYKNQTGQIVQETMKWVEYLDEAGNEQKTFTNVWEDISDDIEKSNKQIDKQKQLYKEIKTILDKLPSSAVGTKNTQDMYSFLDSTTEVRDLQTLKVMAKDYYNQSLISEKQLTQEQKNRQQSIKETFSDYKKIQEISAKVDSGLADTNAIKLNNSGTNIQEFNRLAEAWEKVRTQFSNGEIDFQEANSQIKKLTISTKEFKSVSEKASSATNTFGDRLKKAFQYFTFYDALNLGKRAIKEMVDVIFDLDNALVELQKVSNLTGNSLESFTRQAYELGSKISKSGSEVIRASTEFSRAGFAENEILKLAEASLKLTSIGDGITNVSESANTLIAVLRGFGKETSEVTAIMDAINNTSNNSAVNFNDITMALQRMSGVMNASGVSMEQSIGMFTAINEVLRNTEMTSTALNSLSMRIRGLSEDGEAIDGLAPKLQKMFKDIAGIDITDSFGQVDSLFEIVRKLNPIWDTLTENQKQFIAQEAAGQRQSKAFLIMMDNYDRVLEATSLAYNSAGSSAKEFARWQESLEGRMNNLKSAIEQFSSKTINSNFIKSLISMTTEVIKLGTAFGGAVPVVTSLALAFFAFKQGNIVNTFLTMAITQIKILTTTTIGAVGAVTALQMALGVGFIITGIMAISYAFNKVKNSAEESLNKAKEKISELNEEISNLNSSKSTFANLSKEYETLSKKTNKTSEESKHFYDVQKQLKEILPTLNGFYDEQGNFILNTANNTSELNKQIEEYIRLKKEELALNSKNTAGTTVDKYNEQKKKIEEISQLLNFKNRGFDNLTNDEKRTDTAFGYKYGTDILEITKKLNDAKKEFDEISSQMQSDIFNIIGNTEQWTKATDKQKDAIRELMSKKSADSMAYWSKGLADGTLTVDKFMSTMERLIPNFKELGDVALVSGNDLESKFVSLEKRIEKFNKVSSEMNKVNDILQSLNKNGALTSSEVSSLLEISEDFVTVLGNESELRKKLNTTLDDYKDKHRQAYYDMIKDSTEYYDNLVNGDVNVYNELLTKLQEYIDNKGVGYKVDLKNYKTIEEAKLDITKELIKKVAGVWSSYFDSTGKIIGSALSAKKIESSNKRNDDKFKLVDDSGNEVSASNDLKTIYDIYAELQPLLNGVSDEIDNIVLKTLDIKLDSDIGKKDDVSKVYNARIKALEQQIFLSEKLQSTLKEGSKEWQDEIDKQNKLIQQQKDLTHSEANRLRGLGYSEISDEVNSKIEYWWGLNDKSVQNTQETLDGITLTYEQQNQLLEDRLKLLDIEQSKYNTTDSQYKDITQQKYDTILKQEELLQKQIADLYKQGFKDEAKELEKVSVDLYKTKIALAKEFQSIEVDTLNQQIDNTEKVNNALNTLQKAYVNMRKRQLNETKKMYQEEMKYVDEVYNAKKKALQKERDERYATRDLSDKTKSVSDIQSQLDLIKNDETQMAKRLQLEEELAKAKRELDDFNYDQNYDKQMEALELAQQQAKEEYEYRIELLEERLNDEQWMIDQFNKDIQTKSKVTYQLLMEDAKKYGDTTTTEIAEAWDICTTSLSTFGTKQFEVNKELENMANTLRMIKSLMEEISNMNIETYSSKVDIDVKGGNIPKHHTGINAGVVGGNQYMTKSSEQLIKALKGEIYVKPNQADNFIKNVLPNMGNDKGISIHQEINIDTVDKDSLSDLKKFVKQSNDGLIKQLKETFSNKGIKPNFKNAY